MIEGGKVHYNGQRSKPGKVVELNAELTLRQGNDERTVVVADISAQRRPASEAQQLRPTATCRGVPLRCFSLSSLLLLTQISVR